MPDILVGSCWVLPHVTPISTQAHADAFGGCYLRCSEIASEAILGPLLFRITHFFTGCLYSLDWTTGLDYWTDLFYLLDLRAGGRSLFITKRYTVLKSKRANFIVLLHS